MPVRAAAHTSSMSALSGPSSPSKRGRSMAASTTGSEDVMIVAERGASFSSAISPMYSPARSVRTCNRHVTVMQQAVIM